jgi:hypothetical protein
MKPDRNNYEIWLIDYLDGKLEENQVNLLFTFLNENQDILAEFEEYAPQVSPENLSFPGKYLLKRSVSELPESQFELLCVAAAEGDLTNEQKYELDTLIEANPGKEKAYELFRSIKLIPPEVKYRNKSALKRLVLPQKVFRLAVTGIAAAATIALFITLFNIPGKSGGEVNQIVSLDTSAKLNEKNSQYNIAQQALINEDFTSKRPVPGINVKNTLIPDGVKIQPPVEIDTAGYDAIPGFHSEPVKITETEFKQDIKLVQNEFRYNLAAMAENEISTKEISDEHGFNESFAKFFRERILKSDKSESGTLKGYEVADAGISGLNKLLGWDMSLQKTRDSIGDIKSLYFSSKILKFNTPVRKVQLVP